MRDIKSTSTSGVQTGDILDTCSGTSLTLFRHISINYRRRIAMPWRETTKMSQKLEFITRLQHYDGNFSQLCAAFGISRTTGYKWRHRHADKGEPGLQELSRRPQCSPTITPAPIQQKVLTVRCIRLGVVAKFTGHSNIKITNRYRPPVPLPLFCGVQGVCHQTHQLLPYGVLRKPFRMSPGK